MEKRSHRRIRDLEGLVANEIGCARISMMAREQETLLQRAEYRRARPIISRSSHLACTARPVHTQVHGQVRWQPAGSALGHLRAKPYADCIGPLRPRGGQIRYAGTASRHKPAGIKPAVFRSRGLCHFFIKLAEPEPRGFICLQRLEKIGGESPCRLQRTIDSELMNAWSL